MNLRDNVSQIRYSENKSERKFTGAFVFVTKMAFLNQKILLNVGYMYREWNNHLQFARHRLANLSFRKQVGMRTCRHKR